MRHLYDRKRLIYRNKPVFHIMFRNKLNTEYFTCDKFNIFIFSFAYVNRSGILSVMNHLAVACPISYESVLLHCLSCRCFYCFHCPIPRSVCWNNETAWLGGGV